MYIFVSMSSHIRRRQVGHFDESPRRQSVGQELSNEQGFNLVAGSLR